MVSLWRVAHDCSILGPKLFLAEACLPVDRSPSMRVLQVAKCTHKRARPVAKQTPQQQRKKQPNKQALPPLGDPKRRKVLQKNP